MNSARGTRDAAQGAPRWSTDFARRSVGLGELPRNVLLAAWPAEPRLLERLLATVS